MKKLERFPTQLIAFEPVTCSLMFTGFMVGLLGSAGHRRHIDIARNFAKKNQHLISCEHFEN
jgi:hypothetical protein